MCSHHLSPSPYPPFILQTGVSRHLFERWCDDDRNGVVIAGYTVEGTLAHELLNSPKEIVCQDNRIKPRRYVVIVRKDGVVKVFVICSSLLVFEIHLLFITPYSVAMFYHSIPFPLFQSVCNVI